MQRLGHRSRSPPLITQQITQPDAGMITPDPSVRGLRLRQPPLITQQIAQVGERLGAAKEHRSGLISRQKLLEDLEAKREGVSEGVQSVLRRR